MDFINKLIISGLFVFCGVSIASSSKFFGCTSIIVGLIIGLGADIYREARTTGRIWQTREEGERDIRHLLGELTEEERLQEEAEERYAHNKNAHTIAIWCDSDDYLDYDGNWVRIRSRP